MSKSFLLLKRKPTRLGQKTCCFGGKMNLLKITFLPGPDTQAIRCLCSEKTDWQCADPGL